MAKSHSKQVGSVGGQPFILPAARINLLTIKRVRGYKRVSSSTEAQDADDEDPHHSHNNARRHHYSWLDDDTHAGEGLWTRRRVVI